jgi:WD40 repeat protein
VHLPRGQHVITGSWDGSLQLWNLESGAQIGEDSRDEGKKAVYTIALSPTSGTVASGSTDETVRLWDVETRKVIAKLTGHTTAVLSVCWSADCE